MVFASGVIIIIILLSVKRLWVVACVENMAMFCLALYCVYMLLFYVKASELKQIHQRFGVHLKKRYLLD